MKVRGLTDPPKRNIMMMDINFVSYKSILLFNLP